MLGYMKMVVPRGFRLFFLSFFVKPFKADKLMFNSSANFSITHSLSHTKLTRSYLTVYSPAHILSRISAVISASKGPNILLVVGR